MLDEIGRQAQALQRLTTDDRCEESVGVIHLHVAIPGGGWVDDNCGPHAAGVEAAGAVDADGILEAGGGDLFLQRIEEGVTIAIIPAEGAMCADEDVRINLRHGAIIPEGRVSAKRLGVTRRMLVRLHLVHPLEQQCKLCGLRLPTKTA